jgi:hypothetical protein
MEAILPPGFFVAGEQWPVGTPVMKRQKINHTGKMKIID